MEPLRLARYQREKERKEEEAKEFPRGFLALMLILFLFFLRRLMLIFETVNFWLTRELDNGFLRNYITFKNGGSLRKGWKDVRIVFIPFLFIYLN